MSKAKQILLDELNEQGAIKQRILDAEKSDTKLK